MAGSDATERSSGEDPTMCPAPGSNDAHDRLLPWIAAERALRGIVLVAVGVVLLTHPHADWASEISRLAHRVGLDPNSNWIKRIIEKVKKIGSSQDTVFGAVALAYGGLEGTEAYGLWRRRRWGEWLTVLATSLLLIPEVWELTKSVSALKLGALLANLLIVAYLLWRLRAGASAQARSQTPDRAPDGDSDDPERERRADVEN
jgi:uncharacterized membrane protein (DUF2068 family)